MLDGGTIGFQQANELVERRHLVLEGSDDIERSGLGVGSNQLRMHYPRPFWQGSLAR